jgi:hypothetical protein
MVDALSGLEALVIMAEVELVIGGFLFQLFGAMLGTEKPNVDWRRRGGRGVRLQSNGATNG